MRDPRFIPARIPNSDGKPSKWWVLDGKTPIVRTMCRTEAEARAEAERLERDPDRRAELLDGVISVTREKRIA